MEEMYLLLDDRFNLIEDVRKKLLKICQSSEYPENFSALNPFEVQECSQLILQIKRNDKLRIIKENELMEIVFGLRNFDPQQREYNIFIKSIIPRRFQEKSYELMRKIKQDFVYEKYKKTGETKDIAKLYLNFFLVLKMQTKVDDLKRAYANNKYIGYPIVSILMKWLLEIARKHFQTIIKEKGDKIFSITTKLPRSPAMTPTTIKTKNNDPRSSPAIAESIYGSHNFMDGKPYRNVVRKISKFDTKMTDENSEFQPTTIDIDDTKLLHSEKMRISSEDIRQNYKSYLFDQQKGDKIIENSSTGISGSASQYTNNLLSKNIKYMRSMPRPPNQGNIIQIIMPNTPSIQNTLDVIEDLDLTHISTVYQVIHQYKNIKKITGGNLITIDLDKKKETLNTLYKALYYKNTEVDRTISYYQNKLFEKNMLDYSPSLIVKRRDNFCEGYVVDFPKRFPHAIINNPSLNLTPEFKTDMSPLVKRHSLNANKRAVTAGTNVMVNKSGKSINTEWVDERDNSRCEEIELRSTKQSFTTYQDNQFRIIKKKGSFQEREDYKKSKTSNFHDDIVGNQVLVFPTTLGSMKKDQSQETNDLRSKKKGRQSKKLSDKNRSASVNKFRATTPAGQWPDQGNNYKMNPGPKPESIVKSPKINQKNFKISDFLQTSNGLSTITPPRLEGVTNKENSYLTFIGNEDSRLKLYDIADKPNNGQQRPQSMSVTRRGEEDS